MYSEDVARLCLSTDILIHAQVTDAFSATVQEFLYGGSLLINGGWLDYSDFDLNNIKYIEFNKFDDLPIILDKTLDDIQNIKFNMGGNRKNLLNISSWAANRKNWMRILTNHKF
jgi:hypothetical protein